MRIVKHELFVKGEGESVALGTSSHLSDANSISYQFLLYLLIGETLAEREVVINA